MKFSPERKKIHDEIIKNIFEGKEKSDNPYYLLVAGGPAAGKSTLMSKYEKKGLFLDSNIGKITMRFFNVLPEYKKYIGLVPHPEKTAELIEEFYYIVNKIVSYAANEGYSVIFDDHGDNLQEYKKHCDTFSKKGLNTAAIGVYRTKEAHFEKIDKKIAAGTSNYSEEVYSNNLEIISSFNDNWETIVTFFDGADLFYQDEQRLELIATYSNTGIKKEIVNPALYQCFENRL